MVPLEQHRSLGPIEAEVTTYPVLVAVHLGSVVDEPSQVTSIPAIAFSRHGLGFDTYDGGRGKVKRLL